MVFTNGPHPVASRIDVADFAVRLYMACQEPGVLEAGGDAARAVSNAAKHVEKFICAFRSAWTNG